MVLARKITLRRWENRRDSALTEDEMSADAVTDLRTTRNALSFWKCESGSEEHIEPAAVAIAANAEQASKVDIVWLPEDALSGRLSPQDSAGRTPYRAFVSRHCDVRNLDYGRLGQLARIMDGAIRGEDRTIRISKRRVRRLLQDAVASGKIEKGRLHRRMRESLGLE